MIKMTLETYKIAVQLVIVWLKRDLKIFKTKLRLYKLQSVLWICINNFIDSYHIVSPWIKHAINDKKKFIVNYVIAHSIMMRTLFYYLMETRTVIPFKNDILFLHFYYFTWIIKNKF